MRFRSRSCRSASRGGRRRLVRRGAGRRRRSGAQRPIQDHGPQGHGRAAAHGRGHRLRRLAPARQRLHPGGPGAAAWARIASTSSSSSTTCSTASGCWATRSARIGPDCALASHQVADMVFEKILGIRGAFATRIAYVSVLGSAAEPELPAHRRGRRRRESAHRHAVERAADVAGLVARRPEPRLRLVRGPAALGLRAAAEDRRAAAASRRGRASIRRRRGPRTARSSR